IAGIIGRCLERNPDLRYASVAEIEADLNKQQPTPARWRLRIRKIRARRLVAVLAIWFVVLLGAYGIISFLRRPSTRGSNNEVASAPELSLAILPFTNVAGDKTLDSLGPTLADILRTDIGQSNQFRNVSGERLRQVLADLHLSAGVKIDSSMRKLVS